MKVKHMIDEHFINILYVNHFIVISTFITINKS